MPLFSQTPVDINGFPLVQRHLSQSLAASCQSQHKLTKLSPQGVQLAVKIISIPFTEIEESTTGIFAVCSDRTQRRVTVLFPKLCRREEEMGVYLIYRIPQNTYFKRLLAALMLLVSRFQQGESIFVAAPFSSQPF